MSRHTISGFITYEKSNWTESGHVVRFMTYEPTTETWPERVVVRKHSFEVEVPDDFNPVPALVANIEEEKRLLRAKLAQELRQIDDKLAQLLCIEHQPAEVTT